MVRTKEELIDDIMDENAGFILGSGAGSQANKVIRELLSKALLDDRVLEETWKKFFRDNE